MKIKVPRTLLRTKPVIAVVLVVAVVGFSLIHSSYAASGGLAFSPASGSYNVGDTFNVAVQESGTAATTVQAVVQFPSSLQFVSDTTAAPFSFNPNNTDAASNGSVTITRSILGSSANGTVTTITFKVLSAGSATVSFAASPNSYILPPGVTSISGNALTSAPSAAYTLTTPSTGGGGGTTTPPVTTPPTTTKSAVPATTPVTKNAKSTSVSVKASGSTSSGVTVPDNTSVAVSTPVSVQPASVQTDGVQKIEYYLNGKLVDTATKAPYNYNIDTTKFKNGTYSLVSKTYYSNGTTKQATQRLVVKNAAKKTNLTWLYLLIVALVLLAGVGVSLGGSGLSGRLRPLLQRFKKKPAEPMFTPATPTNEQPVDYAITPGTAQTIVAPGAPEPEEPTSTHEAHEEHSDHEHSSTGSRIDHLPPPAIPTPGASISPNK
jgi:hypothetical protein